MAELKPKRNGHYHHNGNPKHGLYRANIALWNTWQTMIGRCENPNRPKYKDYGGRGIEVCQEWHDAETFGSWAEASGFQKGLTLERKDVNGNYCPENCTWATAKQQANNRRNTIFLEWNGERKSIHQWADELGVSASTLKNRYYLGWSVEEILTLSVSRRKPRRGNLSA